MIDSKQKSKTLNYTVCCLRRVAAFHSHLASALLHFYHFFLFIGLSWRDGLLFDLYSTVFDTLPIVKFLQFGELKLEELFDTLPPGLDEAIAISKVCIANKSYFLGEKW